MKNVTRKRAQVKARLIVGMDVSKDELVTYADELGHLAVPNTPAGWRQLLSHLGERAAVVGLESTGPYGIKVQQALQNAGVEVVQVNPMHTSRLKEVLDNSPSKNDFKDAMLIADIVSRGQYLSVLTRQGAFAELRLLHRSLMRTQLDYQRTRNRSHATNHGSPACTQEVRWFREDELRLKKRKSELETTLTAQLEKVSYGARLAMIPQLGKVTAARVLAETGDLLLFANARQLQSLAGLQLVQKQSGKYCGRVKVSKRGRPELRRLLYYASLRMVKEGEIFHGIYRSRVDRGQEKLAALVACMRKLLGLLLAVARDDEGFDRARWMAKDASKIA